MSEEKLERALEAMKAETTSPEELESARSRVRQKLGSPGSAACAELAAEFQDYLEGRISGSRRLLIEDHLGRCRLCRARLAELRGETRPVPVPGPRTSASPRWRTWLAAAVLLFGIIYLGRDAIDTWLAHGKPRATVASVTGDLNLVPEGALKAGAAIGENQAVRTGAGAHAALRLADGSLVEINERTELSVRSKWSGRSIWLERGDIIVQAAKQRFGRLSVQTRDTLASVKGTVFAVSTGLGGTRVSVIEGAVAVTQNGAQIMVMAGEQAASKPAPTGSLQSAFSWSPNAETYLAVLASLAKIEKEVAGLPHPSLRTESGLIQYMPGGTFFYGAVPNLGETIAQATMLAEQQAGENPAFNMWWNSGPGSGLKNLVSRLQSVTHLLGNEIVYGFSAGAPDAAEPIPLILAEIRPGKRAELEAALNSLAGATNASSLRCSLGDSLLACSGSPKHLKLLLGRLGQGASTPFAGEIAARYQNGTEWLLGVDMDALLSLRGMEPAAFVKSRQMRYIFWEQHRARGIEENGVTVTFHGSRKGLASLPANAGSGGATEYISSDAAAAFYLSTREPRQLLEEMLAQISRSEPSLQTNFALLESKLGIGFINGMANAFGTESAFTIERFDLKGPVWVLAAVVNDPTTLENSLRRLAEICNAEMERSGQATRFNLSAETAGGWAWTSLSAPPSPLSITWTYDRGYLIAGSDRGAVLRALAVRNGGSPLVWSAAFQQQMPSSAGLHPAGFAWLNAQGEWQNLAKLMPNPAFEKLFAERDPILVVFSGAAEQIRAASRTRLSGLLMDILLLQGAGRMRAGPRSAPGNP